MSATSAMPEPTQELFTAVFEALRRTTGLNARMLDAEVEGLGTPVTAARIEIEFEGQPHRYLAIVKRIDRFATLGSLKHQIDHYGEPGLLVALHLTPEAAEQCRALELPFVDAAGNAYLRAPGIFVFVKGQRLPADHLPIAAAGPRAGTATAHRVIFALLCRPELLNAPYRELARVTGVALGAIGWVFTDLKTRGFMIDDEHKKRRLIEPTRLFEEWVTTYPVRLRPKLHPRRFRAADPDWWKTAATEPRGAQWGGEVAADRLTGYLKPATFTLYLQPQTRAACLAQLAAAHHFQADPKGNIELLDTFWNFPGDDAPPDVVPPMLVYADLVATLDPRNLETGKLIRNQLIDHALRQF